MLGHAIKSNKKFDYVKILTEDIYASLIGLINNGTHSFVVYC